MIRTEVYDRNRKMGRQEKDAFIAFLFEHLEKYGDPRLDIEKAIEYALSDEPNKGGFVMLAYAEGFLAGGVVMNETGMKDYIPENILVYIATHRELRGKGIGKELMVRATERASGSVALHVEPDNPARYLYSKVGFTNKYLEMRLAKP